MRRRIGTSMLLVVALCAGSGLSGGVGAAATGPPAPPGGTIAFSYGDQFPGGDLFAPGDVFTVRPDGSHLQQLTHAPDGTNAALPDISKDGTKIVYEVGDEVGTYEIWTMGLDGSNQTQITDEPGFLHLTPSWSPDGKQIVFSRCDLPFGFVSSCDIAVIDADGSHLRTVVGGHLTHSQPKFSPDGKRIVFDSDRAGALSSVWIVNRDGSHLRRVTAANTMAFWPDWSPDGSRISYSDNCCRPHSNLWSVRPDGSGARRLTNSASFHNSSFGSYGPSGRDIVFVKDDAYPDFCCNDLVIRRGDGSLSTVLAGLEGLVLPSWGPAVAEGVAASSTTPVASRHAATRPLLENVPAATPATGAGRPLSGRILFSDFNEGEIYGVNSDGSGLAQLTHNDVDHVSVQPQATPDGRIVFSQLVANPDDDQGRIWIMDADGGNPHQLASDTPGYRDYSPNVTPDGKRVVFARCQPGDGVCGIWIMRFDGTQMRALTPFRTGNNEAVDFSPTLSADGKQVAFDRFGWHGIAIQSYVIDIDGRHEHAVTQPGLESGLPDFAPNGDLTVSSRAVRLGNSVYTMKGDGRHLARLTSTPYPNNDFGSVYSPNGRNIAFSSDRNYSDGCCVDLFVMDTDGSHERQVPLGGLNGSQIAWVPAPPGDGAATAQAATAPAATVTSSHRMANSSMCAGRPAYMWLDICRQGVTTAPAARGHVRSGK